MNDAILKLNAVGKRFPGVVALRDVSLEIRRGDTHVLLGENGAGKSTLLKLLLGLLPFEGTARVLGVAPSRAADLDELVRLYEVARFSEHAVTTSMRDAAIDAVRGLRAELREST